jgi:hypothetical protein
MSCVIKLRKCLSKNAKTHNRIDRNIIYIILSATNTILTHIQNYIKTQIQPFSYRVQGSESLAVI